MGAGIRDQSLLKKRGKMEEENMDTYLEQISSLLRKIDHTAKTIGHGTGGHRNMKSETEGDLRYWVQEIFKLINQLRDFIIEEKWEEYEKQNDLLKSCIKVIGGIPCQEK
jgi:flagellar biosynthesis/type III secretory pathway chaperone